MSVADGFCEFCSREDLLSTGDESSVIFYTDDPGEIEPVLWCGVCNSGSLVYFEHLSTDRLDELMNKSIQMLRNDPIQWDNITDDPKTHLRKIFINDEIGRARQELAFRKVR